MGFQDLTPELRTRLSRVERAVGVFVLLATLLLLAGFAYYLYHTAESRGWLVRKVPYHIYVRNAGGLKQGDKVKLMGFEVGEITLVEPTDPSREWFVTNNYNVFVSFWIKSPYYGYIWRDSRAKVNVGDFLGNRFIEVTKGQTGKPTVKESSDGSVMIMSRKQEDAYLTLTNGSKGYWLAVEESSAVTEKLEQITKVAEVALPNILNLTNQISQTLTNASRAVSNLDSLISAARPTMVNLSNITQHLSNPQGSLGEWLLPTNLNQHLDHTLVQAQGTLTNVNHTLSNVDLTLTSTRTAVTNTDANLSLLVSNLNLSLENIAGITSNLNAQVQVNTNILADISAAVVHADGLVQGLKRHWLLRSAFKEKKTNSPPAR